MSGEFEPEPPRESETNGDDEKSKKKKKHKRSHRSRSRKKHSRSPRKSKSKSRARRSRSPRRRPRRSRSPRRRGGRRSRSKSPEDPKLKAEAEERELNRDAYTVFVTQLHPRVEERDLFEFFSHVGRVEDIRMIRDQRTHKSKGLAYVEFWEKDCVNKAIALTGQELGGYPITVQITPTVSQVPSRQEEIKPMRLYVGSLHFNVTESDLRPVFEAFGVVESIELHKDPSTGKSRGFGFVTYKNEGDARQALANLNGLEIAGRPMKVGIVSEGKDDGGDTMGVGDLDEDGGGMVLSAENRVRLMQKLQRGNEMGPMAPAPQLPTSYSQGGGRDSGVISAARDLSVPLIQPSTCVVVKHMFDPKEEKDADFHLDIKEDVEEECTKFGKLKHIFVDKHSQGHVYLRFANIDGALKCVENLHNRWFASKRITAEFVVEATYLLKFPDAK